MPILVACSSCRTNLQAPDNSAGGKVRCPKCKTVLEVPVPQAVPVLLKGPSVSKTPKLIPCPACGNRIAVTARACPHCGAANGWVHPEIERFMASLDQFQHMPQFQVRHDGVVLTGTAEVTRGQKALVQYMCLLMIGGVLCFLYGTISSSALAVLALVIGPLAVIAGLVLMLVSIVYQEKSTDFVVTFTVDFRHDPLRWQADDENFWQDVRACFLQK